ncbi:LuxR family transcriptional regulator [Actinomadura sp. KC06]|uniref:helix-turn-helix transcriptional regulator n=1 Tax=Actinomadura sp. KC06 TaxID=2530369 RepID=UPI00105269D2|nr:helix-turn-helix transcriptional regulator [Actinomadura sp. KC06]TDD36589.1 LuxR family transcriptional regulator [Actinomadura sp. KC06]
MREQEQLKNFVKQSRHEILCMAPAWPGVLRSLYQSLGGCPRPRVRVIVPGSSRSWILRPVMDRVERGEVRSDDGPFSFLLLTDRTNALVWNEDKGALDVRATNRAEFDGMLETFEERWDRARPADPEELYLINDLQSDIFRKLAMGMTTEATARALNISPRTVQRHVSNVMQELGARSRLELGMRLAAADLV